MADYSIQALLQTPTLPALGPTRREEAHSEASVTAHLEECVRAGAFAPSQRELIRALLLLWHDHLEAAHTIAQGIPSADGSFIHAMVHRREPDYWNAKYWWRRVGAHPAFPEMARRVNELLTAHPGGAGGDLVPQLLPGGKWDACAYVDACELAVANSAREDLLREIQRVETEVLLAYFLRV